MSKKIISVALILSILLLLLLNSSLALAEQLTPPLPGAPSYIDIDVDKAHEMLEKNPEQIILLDVRSEGEYSAEYIPGAINIPLPELEPRIDELDNSKTIIVCSQSGDRSRTAGEILARHGFVVYNMVGGINAWREKFATSKATPAPTPISTPTPAVTPSPDVSPAITPIASPSPVTSPIFTPAPEEKKRIPGFEVTFAIAAMTLITWCLLRRRSL